MEVNENKIKEVIKDECLEYTTNRHSIENGDYEVAILKNGKYEILRGGAWLSTEDHLWAYVKPVIIEKVDDDPEVNYWVEVDDFTFLDTDFDSLDEFENAIVNATFEYYNKEE